MKRNQGLLYPKGVLLIKVVVTLINQTRRTRKRKLRREAENQRMPIKTKMMEARMKMMKMTTSKIVNHQKCIILIKVIVFRFI